MKKVKFIIFRYLTNADFFNIYKPTGTEEGGGGQAYIDFPTLDVPVEEWGKFFEGVNSVVCDTGEQGPVWYVPLNSIGSDETQEIKIYQRRAQSVCVASQRITSARENRVKAWHPDNGFPKPNNPNSRDQAPDNLLVFLVRTEDDEFWAGWSLNESPTKDKEAKKILEEMGINNHDEGYSKFVSVDSKIYLDTKDTKHPFTSSM